MNSDLCEYATKRAHSIVRWLGLTVAATLTAGCAGMMPWTHSQQTVVRTKLDNGMRVVIVPNRLAPVATTVMTYHVGANETPPGFPGTAHALEHMMFRGSPGLSASQLSAISALTGANFNAMTRQTVTQYFFTVPAQYLDTILHVQSARMRGILATPALWHKERGAIEQEVAQDHSNPEYLFYQQLIGKLFQGTPYAHDGLGTRPSFNKTTAAALHQFYNKWYAPNNATLVIVGDVDPKKTLVGVKKLFGDITAKPLPPRPQVKPKPVQPAQIKLDTDKPYGLAILAFRMPGYRSHDSAAAQVLGDVLDSQRGELYTLVTQGKALGANFSIEMQPDAGIGYAVAAFPRGADGAALLKQMRSIISHRLSAGVAPDLVAAAKRNALREAESAKNSISGLAMTWADALTVEGLQSPAQETAAIQKVSVKDVDRVARNYLGESHAITAILTPQSSGNAVAGNHSFSGKESFATGRAKNVKLPVWAERALSKLSVPKSSLHPTVKTLDNGLKVIVQPAHTSHTISVYGRVRNHSDMTVPAGEEGADKVLSELFSYGTQSQGRVAFQRSVDNIGAELEAGENFQLTVLADHFSRGLDLLAEQELHPALPHSAFMTVRRQVASETAGRLQSPDFHFSQALRKALYPVNDPTLRHATPDSVSKLSLTDIKAYYHKLFRPDLTTIVVIGDITPDRAVAAVKRAFGDWHASGPKPDINLPRVPLNTASSIVVPDQSRVQDRVLLAETLGITRKDPQYYALKLGNQVLSGSFYASRLYHALREQRGLVYYVASSVDADQSRAHLSVAFGADPDNVTRADAIVRRELRWMGEAPVRGDELHRAQAQLVHAIPLGEASQRSIAEGYLSRVSHDLPLDEPTRAAHRYLEMTPATLQETFHKLVRPDELVRVSQGPAPR